MNMELISPEKLKERQQLDSSLELIDVRTPVEFRTVHVQGAKNVPLDQLDPAKFLAQRNGSGDEPIYFICRSGSRAKQACEKLLAAGHANVCNVEGGTQACIEAKLPVVRGQESMSLERQVRIEHRTLVEHARET